MDTIAPFSAQQIEAVARVLADTSEGLTGQEITFILGSAGILDVDPRNTKWKRLYNAIASVQAEKGVGNHLLMVVTRALDPVRYTNEPGRFESRRQSVNAILVLAGFELGDDGKLRRVRQAQSVTEAVERASRLSAALLSRGVHGDVLKYCRAELLDQNYFHAVFEATKSIAAKVRALSGLDGDGAELIQRAFAVSKDGTPLLAINSLSTETDRGEQRGFVSLVVGLFGTVRNPLAHNPKVEWPMSEQDALDILTLASLVHRKLDSARRSKSQHANGSPS